MEESEWELLLEVLEHNGDWGELWNLVQQAPPYWGMRILKRLQEAGFTPAQREQADYQELSDLVKGMDNAVFGSGETCFQCLSAHAGPVEALAVSPDGQWLASACADSVVHLWQLPEATLVRSFPWQAPGPVNCLLFSGDGRSLAGGGNYLARIWVLVEGGRDRALRGCTGAVKGLAFTPDGKTLVTLCEDFAQVWDLTEDEPEGKPLDQGPRLTCLAISPNGEVLATGTADGVVWLAHHLPHGELKDQLVGHGAGVTSLAFTRDGQTLASADRDGQVRLWRVKSCEYLGSLEEQGIPLTGRVFAPAAKLVTPGNPAHSRESLTGPNFEPDPNALVGMRRSLRTRLWSMPDGRMLAAQAGGKRIRLWSPRDGHAHGTLTGHDHAITCLAASAPLMVLASASIDGTIRLWGLPTRTQRLGRLPMRRLTLDDWEWVRGRLKEADLPPREQQGLRLLNALLRQRFCTEVHVEDRRGHLPGGEHDIALEE
jgi:WD40 repeat protein